MLLSWTVLTLCLQFRFGALPRYFGQLDSTLVSIGIAEILQGVSDIGIDYDLMRFQVPVPRADGTKVVIDPQLRWLTEDLFCMRIESHNEEEDESAGMNSLRGAVITWAGLSQHLDADRDMVTQLQQVIQKELEKRSRTRINLTMFQAPGDDHRS